ncbi:MAG: helix-turn-helix transcriptional regulator, partial [Catenulispora sp.]|nr:helix-turn-helix transcriptional regulator [Catenulispora sp.]
YSEQALFLARAAELTTDPAVRAARCLQAAAAYLIVGDAGAVQRQLDLAAPDLAGPVARARAKRIQACTEMLLARASRVAVTLLEAVDRLGAADPAMTWDLLYEALAAAIVSADLTRGTTLPLVARRAAGAWHDPAPPPWSSGPLMYGLALGLGHGYARGVPVLREALRTMRDCETVRETGIPLSVTIAHAADQLWDIEAKRELAQRVAEQDRRHGALHGLSLAQVVLAAADISDGRFAAAEARYSENDEYAGAAGVVIHGDLTRPLLYAWTGREAELRRGVETMAGIAAGAGLGSLNRIADQAQAVFEIGSGRYGRALEHVRRLFDDDTVALGNVTLALMVEAGIRAGDRAAALAAFERIEHRAPLAGTPWALGSLARCRAMLAADDDAEPYYRESIERLGEVPVAMELAWSQLVYGEWLRRRRRRSDARVQLRAAFEAFDSRGAAPFAERARAELLASGETARKRTIDTRFDLTPQERQVALLAASGLTNGEIATRLFVTTATIEFHLSKVFRKLGITSRRQIASVLGTGEPAP